MSSAEQDPQRAWAASVAAGYQAKRRADVEDDGALDESDKVGAEQPPRDEWLTTFAPRRSHLRDWRAI